MTVRHPRPPGRARVVVEGVLAVALLASLVAALVSALAWALVQGLLMVLG